jgi:hypothetical protein
LPEGYNDTRGKDRSREMICPAGTISVLASVIAASALSKSLARIN